MTARVDIWDQPAETLGRPVVVSIAAHAGLVAAILLFTQLGNHARVLWGDPHALGGGGSVGITPVRQIPLPTRAGPVNPLANDTESQVPAPPKPQPKKAPPQDPDAIALKGRTKPAQKEPAWTRSRQTYRPNAPDRPNQLYSSAGQAMVSPMYGMQMGTGGVGMGPGGAFGSQFGWYRDLLERMVGQKWRTDDVNPRLRTAPPVVVTFDLLRNGSIKSVIVEQSSGDYTLDNSAKRAIYDAAPFPQLPAGFNRDSARIEFWFQLKR